MVFGERYMPELRGRVVELKNRLVRARYFRGHGVHSPFVYAIVRQVFMNRRLLGREADLFDTLRMAGVSDRRALELQNLMTHCHYRTFSVYGGYSAGPRRDVADADLCILLGGLSEERMSELVQRASVQRAAIVVMSPNADSARERLCRAVVAAHCSTTVDNRGYLLIFNSEHLPKQHFRI